MSNNFGFGPGNPSDPNDPENNPNFKELFEQLSNFGLNPQTLFAAANSAGSVGPLISPDVLRDVARKFVSSQGDLPVGSQDIADSQVALDIANTWLDEATNFPALSRSNLPAYSRRDWLDSTVSNWAKMIEPLADGMASALTNVLKETSINEADAVPELAAIAPIMRAFMGSLIASQLGTSVGQLAVSITGSNDIAIPLFGVNDARLIPQNISKWAEGLEIPIDEVRIFLAVREAAASRLFSHAPWLSQYIQDAITAYGAGIKIDIDSIQEQAERALETGELDINNPESISVAISAGLFKPEQSASQDAVRPEGDALARYGNNMLPVDFYQAPAEPTRVFVYPYARTLESLNQISYGKPDPHFGHKLRYVNPATGASPMPTIGAFTQRLPAGFETRPYRSTDGTVYVCLEGEVTVSVGNKEWHLQPDDIFVVPSWQPLKFLAQRDTTLFSFSDRPIQQSLGLWREARL